MKIWILGYGIWDMGFGNMHSLRILLVNLMNVMVNLISSYLSLFGLFEVTGVLNFHLDIVLWALIWRTILPYLKTVPLYLSAIHNLLLLDYNFNLCKTGLCANSV